MNNFNDVYNKVFDDIKPSDALHKKIKNFDFDESIINNEKRVNLKLVFIPVVSILIIIVGIFYRKPIINAYKSLVTSYKKDDNKSSCIISLPIKRVKNKSVYSKLYHLSNVDKYYLEELIGSNILWNNNFNDELDILRFEKNDDNILSFATFSTSEYKLDQVYPEVAFKSSLIKMSIGFLTTDAPDYMKDTTSYERIPSNNIDSDGKFYVAEYTLCDLDSFEVHKVNSISLYIKKNIFKTEDGKVIVMYANKENKIERMIEAYFEYDNVLYKITGEYVNKNMIVDFVKALK